MHNEKGITHAVTIEGDGHGKPLVGEAISQTIKDDALAWVHLDANEPSSREWLQRELTYLDNIIIDALLAEETRPRILEFESGALMILRGVNLNEDSEPEDMISIRLWVDAHRIISVHRRPLKTVQDIQKRLSEGRGPKNSGDFVVQLVGRLFERMEPVFSGMDERLDDIEELVMDAPEAKERQVITEIRKQAIVFRRYIAPQRDMISHLRTSEQPWLDQTHRRRLQEAMDRVIRYIEDLDTIRERAQIVKDELSNTLADRMNKNMYVLSVIAAIFLPLGFLTGLLGINVGGIPGSDNGDAFYVFCGILMLVVALQVLLFKKMRWF
ncbi:MAG: zinc transporter ZntB [Micavibrio sp. TMED27]|nr:zinc transporter ZntB [Micavibrio sp.]OUT91594.1 MAG: zinc transporter ZntB [Micavibrio sp. TMED27]|tara:strand:- start:3210 stop:4187 length:978 start_codon:yes stop_codon:yes gene_type:complete